MKYKLRKFLLLLSVIVYPDLVISQSNYEEGLKQYYADNNQKAIDFFTKSIENNEKLALSYLMRGATYIYMNKYNAAAEDINTSLKIDSSNYKTYFYFGQLYFAQVFFGTAITYYDKATTLNSKDPKIFGLRGIAKAKLGDFENAINDATIAINLDTTFADYYSNRGYYKLELKLYNEAIADCNAAIKKGHKQQSFAIRGSAYSAIGKHKEAIADFTKAIENMPHAKDLNYLRGLSLKALGKFNEACSDFKKSAQLGYEPSIIEQKKCVQ